MSNFFIRSTLVKFAVVCFCLVTTLSGMIIAEEPAEAFVLDAAAIADIDIPNYETIDAGSDIRAIAFSKDNGLIASANGSTSNADFSICVWNVDSGSLVAKLTGHTDTVNDIVFSPDGQTLVSASNDDTIRIWNYKTGVEERKIENANLINPYTIDINSGGNTIISGSSSTGGGTVYLWDLSRGSLIDDIIFNSPILDVAYNQYNNDMAILLGNGDVHIKDSNTSLIKSHTKLVKNNGYGNLSFSADGQYLAVSNTESDRPVILERQGGYEKQEIAADKFNGIGSTNWERVFFTEDGKYLSAVSNDALYLYYFSTGQLIKKMTGQVYDARYNTVAISPNCRRIATANPGIKLMDSSKLPKVMVKSITIIPSNITLDINKEYALKLNAVNDDGTTTAVKIADAEWIITDNSVVYVDKAKEALVAKGNGVAVVKASYSNASYKSIVQVPGLAVQVFSKTQEYPKNKIWTVKFNNSIRTTDLASKILVTDSMGVVQDVKLTPSSDAKSVVITYPGTGYISGEIYILSIKDIYSTSGKLLSKPAKMAFKIQK